MGYMEMIKEFIKSTLFTILFLALFGEIAYCASVHTKILPANFPYTSKDLSQHAIYLECEPLNKKKDSISEQDQSITFYRTNASLPNKYWSRYVAYNNSRFATWGAKRNYSNKKLIWKDITHSLKAGIYGIYVNSLITNKGSATFKFKVASSFQALNTVEFTAPVTNKKANISWINIGEINLKEEDDTFVLNISTIQTPIRLDTVLLVYLPSKEDLGVLLRRMKNNEAISDRQGGLIFSSDNATISYKIQAPKKVKSLQLTIKDFQGNIIKKDKNLTMQKIDKYNSRVDIPLNKGYFHITLQATCKNSESIKTETSIAVLGKEMDEEMRLKSTFGIFTVHGDKRLAKAAGSRWDRRFKSLFRIKKSELSIKNQKKHKKEKSIKKTKNDLKETHCLSFGLPGWITGIKKEKSNHIFGTTFAPPKDWNELDNLLDYFFQNNPEYITEYFEVYNEPLAHWKGTEKELIRFHHAVAKAIKKVKPQTKVLGPCLYSIRMNALKTMANNGLFDKLDGIVMHAYVNGSAPEEEFFQRLKELNTFRNQPKYSKMPIFLTEFGWTSSEGTWQVPVTELIQAQYCARSLALCFSQKINQMLYFCMDFRTKGIGEAAFSLIDATGRPKVGFSAFSTVAKELGGSELIHYLKLAPTTYMVTAKRKNDYVIVLWDSTKRKKIKLPFDIYAGVNMVGTPINIKPDHYFDISQNPIYLFAKNYNINNKKSKSITRIQGQNTPWKPKEIFICEKGWVDKNSVNIPTNIDMGKYTLFLKNKKTWTPQHIDIQRPVDIKSTEINWDLKDKTPSILITLTSNIKNKPLNVKVSLGTLQNTYITLPANTLRQVNFNLRNFTFGKRLTTNVLLQAKVSDNNTIKIEDNINTTVIPAYQTKDRTKHKDFWMNITNWEPFQKLYNEDPKKPDCIVNFKSFYGKDGLEFTVKVRDDEHIQKNSDKNPDRMWAQDSIQIAFDMDIEKEWTAGVGGGDLLGGHRIFGYCIGKDSKSNQGVAFRHRSYTKNLPKNILEPKITSTIERNKDITLYHIKFPWSVLGVDKPLTAGSKIGFALVVNDVDPKRKRKRHGVRIFKGIATTKNPKLFGKIWLR